MTGWLPALYIPAPLNAPFPAKTQLVTFGLLSRQLAIPAPWTAAFPENVQLLTVGLLL